MSCVCLMWLCYFLPYSITVTSPFRRSEKTHFTTFPNLRTMQDDPDCHHDVDWFSWTVLINSPMCWKEIDLQWLKSQFGFSARRKVSSPFSRSIVGRKAVQYRYVMNISYDDSHSILCDQYCYYDNIFNIQIYAVSRQFFQKMNAVHVVLPKTIQIIQSHPISWMAMGVVLMGIRKDPSGQQQLDSGWIQPRSWVRLSLIDYDLIIAEDPTICSIIHYIHVCSKVDLMPLSLLWSFVTPALTDSSGCRSIFAVKTVDGANQKYFVYICLWILFDKPINLSYQQKPDFNRWFLLKFASWRLRHFNCSSMG